MTQKGRLPRRPKVSSTSPARGLLYAPATLPPSTRSDDASGAFHKVAGYLKPPLNDRQERAFMASFEERLTLLWGPPGTGKTTTLAATVLGWLEVAWEQGRTVRIGIGSSNYNAINKLLEEIVKLRDKRSAAGHSAEPVRLIRLRSEMRAPSQDQRLEDIVRPSPEAEALALQLTQQDTCVVVGGTWRQFIRLAETASESNALHMPWFDLLLIDEASQVKVDFAAAYYTLVADDGNVVLAGDNKQLGPVNKFEIEDDRQGLLDCIFTYSEQALNHNKTTLNENYRTNREIAEWPRIRFYKEDYEAMSPYRRLDVLVSKNRETPTDWPTTLPWSDLYSQLLDPELPVCVVTYPADIFTVSNPFESQTVASLSLLFNTAFSQNPNSKKELFWEHSLGIVTPHRAQMSNIRSSLTRDAGFGSGITPFVDTVDGFQGQERDAIFSSYTVSDRDFVASEAEFILSSRRFNVALTRAKAKFIMFVSEAITHYLPPEAKIAHDASHLQLFIEKYCSLENGVFELPYFEGTTKKIMKCKLYVKRAECEPLLTSTN